MLWVEMELIGCYCLKCFELCVDSVMFNLFYVIEVEIFNVEVGY